MGPKLFKVPSKSLLISLICWFAIVGNMWEVLSTLPYPNIANNNLENKSYFCLGLLANLVYLQRLFDARSSVLVIFDPLYPSRDVIPLGALGEF